MKITRQIDADKIADYLYGKVSQAELVDWAERAMMDADFEEADTELLTDIIGRLGLADVAEFGLRWQDCEEFLRRLGYRAKVKSAFGIRRKKVTTASSLKSLSGPVSWHTATRVRKQRAKFSSLWKAR